MSVQLFLTLLSGFSVITGVVVEVIKKAISDKYTAPYNLLALIVAVVVGCGGTFVYYQLSGTPVGTNDVIYAILMGLASAMCSMLGYDKIAQMIKQLAD